MTENLADVLKMFHKENDERLLSNLKGFIERNYKKLTEDDSYSRIFCEQTFLRKKNLSIENFEILTPQQLKLCVKYDNSKKSYEKLIFRLLRDEEPESSFIFYLINKGFGTSDWELSCILRHGYVDLLKYYRENGIVKSKLCHPHVLKDAVQNNHKDLILYILENELIEQNNLKNNLVNAIEEAEKTSKHECLQILQSYKDKSM